MTIEETAKTETTLIVKLPDPFTQADIAASVEALIAEAKRRGATSSMAAPLPLHVERGGIFRSGAYSVRFLVSYDVEFARTVGRADTTITTEVACA